ncbi:hypothetical protein GLUCOINTEAF2_0203344 [Komagataeibacter intermedius AF2]|uniref:Uncharacterized protein n=1 Tax=Komagataeibacter intermedius AF2 TaxID=1458464 RepID=A0A0N1FIZ3_9PROT|nr:hypothetical protein [Komagataeibacter intermedius]KPH85575.1 hypothetical protein GLUCOINTEAF2_0203344 [Komagataeibacter intermedius AF2]
MPSGRHGTGHACLDGPAGGLPFGQAGAAVRAAIAHMGCGTGSLANGGIVR